MFDRKAYMKKYDKEHPKNPIKAKAVMKRYYYRTGKNVQKTYRVLHPEAVVFHGMVQRCHDPNAFNYSRYGGRGIKCLFESYHEIIEEIGPRPSDKYSIDRIDNDGHYERGNIRWVTMKQQMQNQRSRNVRLRHS